MTDSSEIPGFYKLSPAERMRVVQKLTGIADEEAKTLGNTGGLPPEVADRMRENVVGGLTIPLGIATNFLINGKEVSSIKGPTVIAELIVNTGDAMGANAVNTMAEAVAPMIEQLTKGRVLLRIISNLADRRLVRASAVFDKGAIGGEEVVEGMVYAYALARADPYRCATHNKGIMNGVVAVGIACGQDIRALEAGAHSFAAKQGGYGPLTTWEENADGDLVGTLEMPMAV